MASILPIFRGNRVAGLDVMLEIPLTAERLIRAADSQRRQTVHVVWNGEGKAAATWTPTQINLLLPALDPDRLYPRHEVELLLAYVAHEIGHALFTPLGEYQQFAALSTLHAGVINALEDARMEHRVCTAAVALNGRALFSGLLDFLIQGALAKAKWNPASTRPTDAPWNLAVAARSAIGYHSPLAAANAGRTSQPIQHAANLLAAVVSMHSDNAKQWAETLRIAAWIVDKIHGQVKAEIKNEIEKQRQPDFPQPKDAPSDAPQGPSDAPEGADSPSQPSDEPTQPSESGQPGEGESDGEEGDDASDGKGYSKSGSPQPDDDRPIDVEPHNAIAEKFAPVRDAMGRAKFIPGQNVIITPIREVRV